MIPVIKIYTMLLIIFAVLFTGCKKSGGIIEVKPVKDPRTYTWTADTLGYPGSYQTLMYDIWGSSPKDIYAVGHSSSSRNAIMWHYDGNKWTNIILEASDGGPLAGNYTLNSIYGLSSNDIYAAGARYDSNPSPPPSTIDFNFIIHYDGSTWKEVNAYNGRSVYDIYGNSSSDVWAGGLGKSLYHFNGSKWETDSINIVVQSGYFFQLGSISSYNGSYYTIGNSNDNKGHSIFYLINKIKDNWVAQDSFYAGSQPTFGIELNLSRTESFYSIGTGGVYKYNGASWDNIFNRSSIEGIWGTSDSNIFAAGNSGRVYHYNGVDWKQIDELNDPQTDYFAVWTDGTEAFVVGHINDGGFQKTIVWHGK